MTIRMQIILLFIWLIVLGVIVNMVKKRQLELKYVLIWLACDIVLIIFTCFPGLMAVFSRLMGIYSPVNMIFFLGILVLILICFSLTVMLSRVTAKVRRIAQIVAMLPEEVRMDILKEAQENEDVH